MTHKGRDSSLTLSQDAEITAFLRPKKKARKLPKKKSDQRESAGDDGHENSLK